MSRTACAGFPNRAAEVGPGAPASPDRGATLVEVLVAMLVASVGTLAMAQLFWLAASDNVTAGQDTVATILAAQKLEELRAPALPGVPGGALDVSAPGFVDHVGADGRVVGLGPQAPPSALFTRRWSIEPAPEAGGAAVIARVIAMPARRGGPRRSVWAGGWPGTARVVSIVRRRAS